MDAHDSKQLLERALTRRALLRYGVTAVGGATLAGILAACGGDGEAEQAAPPAPPAETATPPATVTEPAPPATAEEPAAPTGGTLRFALGDGQSADSLDPALQFTGVGITVGGMVYDNLLHSDNDWNLTPALAEDWSANDDATEYTLQDPPGCRVPLGEGGRGVGCRGAHPSPARRGDGLRRSESARQRARSERRRRRRSDNDHVQPEGARRVLRAQDVALLHAGAGRRHDGLARDVARDGSVQEHLLPARRGERARTQRELLAGGPTLPRRDRGRRHPRAGCEDGGRSERRRRPLGSATAGSLRAVRELRHRGADRRDEHALHVRRRLEHRAVLGPARKPGDEDAHRSREGAPVRRPRQGSRQRGLAHPSERPVLSGRPRAMAVRPGAGQGAARRGRLPGRLRGGRLDDDGVPVYRRGRRDWQGGVRSRWDRAHDPKRLERPLPGGLPERADRDELTAASIRRCTSTSTTTRARRTRPG